MTMAKRNGSKGISLKTLHIAMIICAVIISALLVFSTYQSSNVFSKLSKATGNYIVRQKAAHELMEASDYLTEMVQRFTLEGDTQYLTIILTKHLCPAAAKHPLPVWPRMKRKKNWSDNCRRQWMNLYR